MERLGRKRPTLPSRSYGRQDSVVEIGRPRADFPACKERVFGNYACAALSPRLMVRVIRQHQELAQNDVVSSHTALGLPCS